MNNARILVVDDDPVVVDALSTILAKENFEVVGAKGGAEGLRLALETKFDLIISDMQMPDVNGMELLTQLKQAKVRTRFIFLTAFATALRDTVNFVKLGACDVLHKPIQVPDFMFSVNRALVLESPFILATPPSDLMDEALEATREVARAKAQLRKEHEELAEQMQKDKVEFENRLRAERSGLRKQEEELRNERTELAALRAKTRLRAVLNPLIFLTAASLATLGFYRVGMITAGNAMIALPIVLFILLSLPFDRIKTFVAKTKKGEGRAVFK